MDEMTLYQSTSKRDGYYYSKVFYNSLLIQNAFNRQN